MHLVLIMGLYNFHDLHFVVNKQAFQNEIILYEKQLLKLAVSIDKTMRKRNWTLKPLARSIMVPTNHVQLYIGRKRWGGVFWGSE